MSSSGREKKVSFDTDTQLIDILGDSARPQQRAMTSETAVTDVDQVESTFQQTTSNPNPNNLGASNPVPVNLNPIITRNADQIRVIKVNRNIQDVKYRDNSIRFAYSAILLFQPNKLYKKNLAFLFKHKQVQRNHFCSTVLYRTIQQVFEYIFPHDRVLTSKELFQNHILLIQN
jgi:hypothetical protein